MEQNLNLVFLIAFFLEYFAELVNLIKLQIEVIILLIDRPSFDVAVKVKN